MVDPTRPTPVHLVVDGANVVGSRPDGWWRDRPGAARRLAEQLVAVLVDAPDRLRATYGSVPHLHLVLEGHAAEVAGLPEHPGLSVVRAATDGDSAIVALVGELPGRVVVVTADRELRSRVRGRGAATVGPTTVIDLFIDHVQ